MNMINQLLDKQHLKIDLASGLKVDGEIQPEGYILQDIEPHPGIELVCDLLDLEKHLKPGQVQKFRMSHILEHFPTAQVLPILKMLNILLEEGGELEIHVPNFKWHASLLLQDRDEEAVNYAFGGQKDQYDFHKTAFTPRILDKVVCEAGFKIISMVIEASIHIMAKKDGKPQSS